MSITDFMVTAGFVVCGMALYGLLFQLSFEETMKRAWFMVCGAYIAWVVS